ncbi:Transcriptional adapter ada2 [Saitozyma podzolica]|uniref:Transcriptional adapter 2 n=1 Tax=Saitozyma podzolica TaxID=1890683 RepID=A0A427YTU8_9TREE|nr:Transcriptional adapter ada2 [Saitozyma podzolica]
MTVTQRRVRVDHAAKPEEPRGAIESGIKVTCDFCHDDITHTVRFKCASDECKDIDICPNCFCEGKEGQKHKPWHDYMVEEQLSTPIFSSDWGADEEMLLISGLVTYGLGNWLEVAGHVGTRTKEECERHYLEEEAVNGGPESGEEGGKRRREFMPPMHLRFDVDPDEFQARKKVRIEEMRKPHALPPTAAAPLVSAPTNHEVAGYMPGRLEFEHELDNEAEMAVKDMEFGLVWRYGGDEQPQAQVTRPPGEEGDEEDEDEDEDDEEEEEERGEKKKKEEVDVKVEPADEPPDGQVKSSPSKKDKGKGKAQQVPVVEAEDEDELEVKLALLDIYFSKLDKREEAKDIIFDRGLTEHKKILANERKRPKEERELINRYKVFAKLQTAQDFEVLIEGLIYEQNLRKRIADLQEYRRMGITTGAEAEAYDNAKAMRAGYRIAPVQRDRQPEVLTGARVNAGQHRFLHGAVSTPPPDKASREPTPRALGHGGRKPPTPLNLANSASLDLLSSEEQQLCSTLRVLPKPYLTIKEMYIRENKRRKGLLKRRDARRMMKIDVNKSGRIFDFLVTTGMLVLAYDPSAKGIGPGKEGHVLGVPMDIIHGKTGVGVAGITGVTEIHPDGRINGHVPHPNGMALNGVRA